MEMNKNNFNKESKSLVTDLSWEKNEDIEKVKKYMNNKSFDLIIGSELVYLDDLFDNLINVIKTFSDENTFIILSYKVRLPSMVEDFTNKLKRFFEIIYIDYQLKNELYPNPEKLQFIQIKKLNV